MQHLTHKSYIRQNQHWESFNVASLIYLQDWQQMGPKSAEKSVQGFDAVSVCSQCRYESFEMSKTLLELSQGAACAQPGIIQPWLALQRSQ